ncbi:MAG: hypothetical protein II776_02560 [Clostridia bacterium]|nr:hypothetical protein [Clostridia bacterium]
MRNLSELKGKKLLILAGGPNLVTLVLRAKELGVYTVVTDYYETDKSPAKLVADEYWNISWSDLDALEKKCREEKIDGITTGYSESPVGACIRLCRRLGLPCYCTEEQLELTKDKALFKSVCRRNGVPVVKEYASVDEVSSFPVIVKPVDRAGSIGVGIAVDKAELEKAYAYAMEQSYCKSVIIEDFIQNGSKFDVFYAITSGKAILLSSCDTVNAQNNGLERVVQSGWLFPSRYHDSFLKKADPAIRRMIRDLGIRDGYIFFSGFSIESGNDVDFVFFETGFRLSGGHLYQYLIRRGVANILDLFICHALTGKTDQIEWHEESRSDLKCAMVNYYAVDGTIGSITGGDEVSGLEECSFLLELGRVGVRCDTKHAILTKLAMAHFCDPSAEKLAAAVKLANNAYAVLDENGKDMIYDRMDPAVIANWWSKR